jgi:hypothetical protein
MTDDFIVDLKDYIRVERKYPHEAWCDPDDVQAAIDEIERLRAALREAREDILLRHNARGSEAAGTDEEAVSFIDAALAGEKTDGNN